MKKILTIIVVAFLCLSLFSVLAPKVKAAPNLLVNPGFENDFTNLAGWSTSLGTAVYSVDHFTSASGNASAKGVETSTGSLGRLYQVVTGITLPRYEYQISGWIKTSSVVGNAVIALNYVDNDGATPADGYVMEIGSVSGTQDWAFFQSPVFALPTMPSDAQALWFLFDFNTGSGTAWLDDVSLVLVANPENIPTGSNVAVFPDPNVGLTFDQVTQAGIGTATKTTIYPPPPPPPAEGSATVITATRSVPPPAFIGPVWDIKVTAKFTGNVIVGIDYAGSGSVPTHMYQTDFIRGDVNFDGKVNLADLCIITRALNSNPGSPRWNPNCDLNGDHKINLVDLCAAIKNFGKTSAWIDITITNYVDSQHIIYGITDHFSIFGVR